MSKTFVNFAMLNYEQAKAIKSNKENRLVNRGHLNKLKKEWEDSFEVIPPITVNIRTNNVIDGQHRLAAYFSAIDEKLIPADTRIKVMYIDIPAEEEIDAIMKANINSKNWIADDYVRRYAESGNESYRKLVEFAKTHELTVANGKPKLIYAAAIIKGKSCREDLIKGVFTVTDKELAIAEEIHTEMSIIKDIFHIYNNNSWVTTLASSWRYWREQHSFGEWKRVLKAKMRKNSQFQSAPKQSKAQFDVLFGQASMAINKQND